jgi:virginiamycin A acetyltransferase
VPNIIDPTTYISKHADIDVSVKGSVLKVGKNGYIDSFVRIKFSGGMGDIIIGNNCYFNAGTVIYNGNGINIGNCVLIASNVTFAPTNHNINKDTFILYQGFMESKGGIIIEDDVWIGANSVILDGTHIPKGCVIGAGSVVKGKLIENGIYVGNPIQFKKFRI